MGEVLKSSTFSAGANDKLKWYISIIFIIRYENVWFYKDTFGNFYEPHTNIKLQNCRWYKQIQSASMCVMLVKVYPLANNISFLYLKPGVCFMV